MTTKNSEIVNWKNIFAQSSTFQTQKPAKCAFLEEFFVLQLVFFLNPTNLEKDSNSYFCPLRGCFCKAETFTFHLGIF